MKIYKYRMESPTLVKEIARIIKQLYVAGTFVEHTADKNGVLQTEIPPDEIAALVGVKI